MSTTLLQRITHHAQEGARLRTVFFEEQAAQIQESAFAVALAIAKGHKLLLCGNGGSAGDAQHLAGEFVNRFLVDRPPLPAIALCANTSNLTAIANDFGYEQIFSKQVLALGQEGDVLLGISTSGSSANVLAALSVARQKNMFTIGLSGEGTAMARLCDICLAVPHKSTPLVQEVHIATGHMLCQLVDYFLFEDASRISAQLQNASVQE